MKVKSMSLVALWLLCCGIVKAQPQTVEVESAISAVTVFKTGAQVTRTIEQNFPTGLTTFKFINISAKIDKESVQLNSQGDFTILSISNQLNYFEPPTVIATIAALENEKDSLILAIEMNKAKQQVLRQEEKMILANQAIGGNQTGVQIEELRATAEFYRQRLTEISSENLLIKRQNRSLSEALQRVGQQIIELNANDKSKATTEVLVKIEAANSGVAKFELGYFVPDAAWEASYDIRVQDVASPTELVYKANIAQDTDEDWTDVTLTLSTGEPTRSGQEPTLQPWRLGYYRAPRTKPQPSKSLNFNQETGQVSGRILDKDGNPLIGASILVKGASTGTITDYDGNYSVQVPEGTKTIVVSYTGYETKEVNLTTDQSDIVLEEGAILEEVVVTGYASSNRSYSTSRSYKPKRPAPVPTTQSNNTTTHEFTITSPFSIPTDGHPYTVNIDQYEVAATYAYSAVPKLDQDAFLKAGLTNWEQYHLLSGEASLFFENTFIGRSFIDVENTRDTLSISLGRDQNVVINRNKLKDFSNKNLIGNKRVETLAWEIDLRNKKAQAIDLVIKDQIPASVINEIDVKLLDAGGAQYTEDTGLLVWKLRLNPSENRKLQFKYQVKYPQHRLVVLE